MISNKETCAIKCLPGKKLHQGWLIEQVHLTNVSVQRKAIKKTACGLEMLWGGRKLEGIVFVIRLTVKSVERQYSSVLIQMELLWMAGGGGLYCLEGKHNKHMYTVGVAPSVQLGQQVDTHHFVSGVAQWCPGCNKDEWDTDLTCKHSAAVRN